MSRCKHSRISTLFFTVLFGIVLASCDLIPTRDAISGRVLDEHGAVVGAIVRVQTTEIHTITDTDGIFSLSGLMPDEIVYVTAWASGYYIVGVEASPGDDIEIHLLAHTDEDNPDYEWLPSQYHPGQGEDQGCAECHSNDSGELSFYLPVDEWLQDAHSQAAKNTRFLTMYTGRDVLGNQSPQTRYGNSRDYGHFPLLPDPGQPYYGPGYKLDFPDTDGNCAACHTPAASINVPYGVDPSTVKGVASEGVPCDFCHKIWDVRLDPASGLPSANMPGVLSYEFRRPPEGHQFFAGPLDDVAPGEDTYSPIQNRSEFCAPCHFGVFWDTLVYNSFGEWLESPYSDPKTGQTCQDCHMPPVGVTHFALPEAGGLERDSSTIFSHRMPGASDLDLLQNSVTMTVESKTENDKVLVDVTIINDKTGHHVPTDSPLRHMILLVEVVDGQGKPLIQIDGPVVPDWGGIGDPELGYYAGLPGNVYAKVLQELWTEIAPTGAYWNQTRILSDNRIPAMESDATYYVFDKSGNAEVTVNVKLLFRRAFIELMDQKGWDVPDILMEKEVIWLP